MISESLVSCLTLRADVSGVVCDGSHGVIAVESGGALLTGSLSHLILVEPSTAQLINAGPLRTHVARWALIGAGIANSLATGAIVTCIKICIHISFQVFGA